MIVAAFLDLRSFCGWRFRCEECGECFWLIDPTERQVLSCPFCGVAQGVEKLGLPPGDQSGDDSTGRDA